MKRLDCVAVGDLLFVLRAPEFSTLERAPVLECIAGSAECNVMIGLSRLGLSTGIVAKAVDNFIGRWLVDTVRGLGVDVGGVVRTPRGRMGIMFVERGVPPRPSRSVYDREGSAITTLTADEVDWEFFDRGDNFYVSGITAALSESCRDVIRRAVARAKDNGRRVIFDLNHRRQLWGADQARPFLEEILPDVDICFMKPADANAVFAASMEPDKLAAFLKERFSIPLVVVSIGAEGAIAYDGVRHEARSFEARVINRFGVGDAFIAGFLCQYLHNADVERALEYGCATAAIKATIPNEHYPLVTREQVEQLVRQRNAPAGEPGPMDVVR